MSVNDTLDIERHATLKLSNEPTGQVLTCHVPMHCSQEEFLKVSASAYGLINKLTGCNCMSGRISVVVQDGFADVIRVNLERPEFNAR